MFHDITVTSTLYVIRAYNLHEAFPDCIAFDKAYKKKCLYVLYFRDFSGKTPFINRECRVLNKNNFRARFDSVDALENAMSARVGFYSKRRSQLNFNSMFKSPGASFHFPTKCVPATKQRNCHEMIDQP